VQDTVRIITARSSRWRRVQRWTLIEWKPTLETALRIDRARSLLANPAVRIINVAVGCVGQRSGAARERRDYLKEQTMPESDGMMLQMSVNGSDRTVRIDPRVTLLDLLRETLDLTGTKKGCDQGTCGACTVIVDGQRVLSCLTLAVTCSGRRVITIEGLSTGGVLHPMQSAFLECDAFQCGFCTPGQILSAVCLIEEANAGAPSHATADVRQSIDVTSLTDDEIRERMSGNLCRCGAYPNIVAAVRHTLQAEVGR
jgi:aerobic-type carbon monoxide dehydrogenase small subunit (CoxS/CutS family)